MHPPQSLGGYPQWNPQWEDLTTAGLPQSKRGLSPSLGTCTGKRSPHNIGLWKQAGLTSGQAKG